VSLSPLGTSATNWLIAQATDDDDDEYGALGGMRIGRGNRSTRRNPTPVPLCTPQILHDLTWARTRATSVANNHLSYGETFIIKLLHFILFNIPSSIHTPVVSKMLLLYVAYKKCNVGGGYKLLLGFS
jgi:hypothetical protein